jgi:hypothetical protein
MGRIFALPEMLDFTVKKLLMDKHSSLFRPDASDKEKRFTQSTQGVNAIKLFFCHQHKPNKLDHLSVPNLPSLVYYLLVSKEPFQIEHLSCALL